MKKRVCGIVQELGRNQTKNQTLIYAPSPEKYERFYKTLAGSMGLPNNGSAQIFDSESEFINLG